MSNKFPTAHEMRMRSNEVKVDAIPLEELPLYRESLRRLQESTGHCGVTRTVCGIYTDRYADICIEPGTGSYAKARVPCLLGNWQEVWFCRPRHPTHLLGRLAACECCWAGYHR